jgi:predicted nucleic acid-binding protein
VTRAIVDTGPLVAFCDRRDRRHGWVVETFKSEALFLVRHRMDMQDSLLSMVTRRLVTIPFRLEEEIEPVRSLRARYENVPMSLADACLVRMTEMFETHHFCTFDSDFTIYRKHGREPLLLLSPPLE